MAPFGNLRNLRHGIQIVIKLGLIAGPAPAPSEEP